MVIDTEEDDDGELNTGLAAAGAEGDQQDAVESLEIAGEVVIAPGIHGVMGPVTLTPVRKRRALSSAQIVHTPKTEMEHNTTTTTPVSTQVADAASSHPCL